MSLITESNALIDEIRIWMGLPSKLFAVGSPPAFILFASKDCVDFIFASPNAPDILNPWIGLLFLYSISFAVFSFISRSYRKITARFYRLNED
ncbi:MAG: hypothetical protein AB7G75_36880 [Candidatus Binatia bacterium]